VAQIFKIIGETEAISDRNGFQPGSNWICIQIAFDIRSMDDSCKSQQSRVSQSIFIYDGFEGALTIFVPKFYIRGIKGNCACFPGNLFHLAFWDKYKFCLRVDKPAYQPWTGNTVNMYVRASDPFHTYLILFTRCGSDGDVTQILPK